MKILKCFLLSSVVLSLLGSVAICDSVTADLDDRPTVIDRPIYVFKHINLFPASVDISELWY